MIRTPSFDKPARSPWHGARMVLLGLSGLLAVLAVVIVAKNLAVRRAILRINELDGLVTAEDAYLPDFIYRSLPHRMTPHIESIYVLRDGYDVSYGFVMPSCTRGGTLAMGPDRRKTPREPGEAGLLALRDLPRIKSLTLIETSVSDEQLRHVRALDELTYLNLSTTPIDGSGLVHLRGLRRLRALSLSSTRIDDDALDGLDDLPVLQSIVLSDTRVRGVALARLSRFAALAEIYLQGSLVDDRALDELEKLPAIREVGLCRTSVSRERLRLAAARRGWSTDIGLSCN